MFHSILLGINLKDLLYLYEQAHMKLNVVRANAIGEDADFDSSCKTLVLRRNRLH